MLLRIGLLWATVGLSMPLQLSRRMMEQGDPSEVSNPLEDPLATTEEPSSAQGNLADNVKLLAPMEQRDMVQKYKGKLSEISRAEAEVAAALPHARYYGTLPAYTRIKNMAMVALQKKRRELDDLLHQGTRQYYSATFAGPGGVKDAILTTAVGKRLGPDLATVVAQLVPPPDPQVAFFTSFLF